MIYLCITPERQLKTRRLMDALAEGLKVHRRPFRIIVGAPPDDMNPFVVWGQVWLSMKIIPPALRKHRPFWYIDNGYVKPARGGAHGYYRFTYRSMSPILLDENPRFVLRPLPFSLAPWRVDGKHILIAMPGAGFGKALGIDVPHWISTIEDRVRKTTTRPIIIRKKDAPTPLAKHLHDCWALVTHSSNVAVDAVIAGIPVFVEPTSPAAPVGRCDLDFENPFMPDRTQWAYSLFNQQFTLGEMRSGIAHEWMTLIERQVDIPSSPTARKEVHYDQPSAS